ncbi:MAG: hypothetical protein WDO13_19710 [Verrucomicrobiota bacterium]
MRHGLGIFRTLLQLRFSVSVVVILTALAFLTLHLHFAVRPVLFTYLFLALVVEVWNRRTQPLGRDWLFCRLSSSPGPTCTPAGWRP